MPDVNDIDWFGRSGFSRYYYATFWAIRDFLEEIDDKWNSPSHAQIPDLLGKNLLKRIKKVLKTQTNAKLLTHAEAEKLKHAAITCTSQLAEMLEVARSIRVKADYFPNEKCRRVGTVVMLGDIKDGVAADWLKTANRLIGSLRKVCEKIGLII